MPLLAWCNTFRRKHHTLAWGNWQTNQFVCHIVTQRSFSTVLPHSCKLKPVSECFTFTGYALNTAESLTETMGLFVRGLPVVMQLLKIFVHHWLPYVRFSFWPLECHRKPEIMLLTWTKTINTHTEKSVKFLLKEMKKEKSTIRHKESIFSVCCSFHMWKNNQLKCKFEESSYAI